MHDYNEHTNNNNNNPPKIDNKFLGVLSEFIHSVESELDIINNAYSTIEQTLYDNNPHDKRIKFSINLGCHNPTDINIIAEDPLEDIFINLFSNSVKYTDSSEVKIDVLIKDYFIGQAKYWMITISDYGKGIPDSMKKDLFERFYSKAKGSGLGLSIVRTLVERYKGKIWVGDRIDCNYMVSLFDCL